MITRSVFTLYSFNYIRQLATTTSRSGQKKKLWLSKNRKKKKNRETPENELNDDWTDVIDFFRKSYRWRDDVEIMWRHSFRSSRPWTRFHPLEYNWFSVRALVWCWSGCSVRKERGRRIPGIEAGHVMSYNVWNVFPFLLICNVAVNWLIFFSPFIFIYS